MTRIYTPSGEYREEAIERLANLTKAAPLHATRLRSSRDGSVTHLNVLAIGYDMRILDVTASVCQALQAKGVRTDLHPLTISASSGGTSPINDLQERLRRVIGDYVEVRES
jgi:hypothetical protein